MGSRYLSVLFLGLQQYVRELKQSSGPKLQLNRTSHLFQQLPEEKSRKDGQSVSGARKSVPRLVMLCADGGLDIAVRKESRLVLCHELSL